MVHIAESVLHIDTKGMNNRPMDFEDITHERHQDLLKAMGSVNVTIANFADEKH